MSTREDLLRDWWERLRQEVEQLLRSVDPEGLLAGGAPGDEYSSEVDALTSLLVRGEVSEAAVLEVWERAFGPGSGLSTQPAFTSLTGRLIDLRAAHPAP
ncbi:hypothetical protein ACWKWC_03325 [Geodermatophilus nigrescens]